MREDVEALRRRLYRPDATPADLASYLDAAPAPAGPGPAADARSGATEPAPEAEPLRAPGTTAPPAAPDRRRRALVGAVAAGGLVLLGGMLILIRGTQPAPVPTPTAVAVAGAPRAPDDSILVLPTVADRGARAHATGEARGLGAERYRYRVAAGDTVIGVAARFGLCRSEVIAAIPDGGRRPVVEPGEVLVVQHDRDAILADPSGTC